MNCSSAAAAANDDDDDDSDESDIEEKFQQARAQQQAKKRKQQQQQQNKQAVEEDSGEDSSDSDDDDDDDDIGDVRLLADTRGGCHSSIKKKRSDDVDEKLQQLQHRRAVQGRKDRLKANQRDNDDDSDDEDDGLQVVKTKTTAAAAAAKVTVDSDNDDDDSDDEDEVQCVTAMMGVNGTTTQQEQQQRRSSSRSMSSSSVQEQLQHRGVVISAKAASELQKLKAAAEQLQQQNNASTTTNTSSASAPLPAAAAACRVGSAMARMQQQQAALAHQQRLTRAQLLAMGAMGSNFASHQTSALTLALLHQQEEQEGLLRQNLTAMQQQQQQQTAATLMMQTRYGVPQPPEETAGPLTLTLTVLATIRTVLSNDTMEKSCVVTVLESEKVHVVIDKVLQLLQLNPKTNIVGLQYDGQTLHNRQPLDMFGIPETATLRATIHSSDFFAGTAASAACATGTKAAAAAVDVGKLITVTLRRHVDGTTAEEDCMKVGLKEKLQSLADKYAKAKGLSNKKVSLHFDGDALNLNTTPASHDMENEDLIDVVVV